jgi:hypothetical protein
MRSSHPHPPYHPNPSPTQTPLSPTTDTLYIIQYTVYSIQYTDSDSDSENVTHRLLKSTCIAL